MMKALKFTLFMMLAFNVQSLLAAVVEIGPEENNLRTTIDAMQAGDILLLRSGDYVITSRLGVSLNCSAQQLCVIKAKPGHSPHINRPNANQNIMDVESSNYVLIEGIEFSGGSRGIRFTDSSYITLKNNHIHHTGDAAITANDIGSTYSHIKLLNNHIHDTSGTGEGMYLGCNNNGCQFDDGLIANNYIHHTNGPTVSQGDGIEIKEGSANNTISDNVIHDTNYPCILTYATLDSNKPNTIERNLMWGCGDHAIQSATDAVIRNNIILGAAVDGIRSQPHQNGIPDNLIITHNTVFNTSGSVVRVDGIAGTVVIANNALYSQSGEAIRVSGTLNGLEVTHNVGEGSLLGIQSGFTIGNINNDFINASYSNSLPQDVFPAMGSSLIGAASSTWLNSDDFNYYSRSGSLDVGAYLNNSEGNPSWTLSEEAKPSDVIFADGFGYEL